MTFSKSRSAMRLTVQLYASYADAFGAPHLELDVPDGVTVGELVERVRTRDATGRLPDRPLVAVNLAYARWDQSVDARDEVAIIPPVAGG